jgi:hypothetical protein
MKRCPKCQRSYDDDTLRFCLEDGAVLTGPSTRASEPPPTEIMPERGAPTLKVSGPTSPSFPRSPDQPTPRPNQLLTVGVIAIALLLLALVGIAGYFVLRQPAGTQTAQTNGNNEQKAAANKNDVQSSPDPAETPLIRTSQGLKITADASSVRYAVQSNTYYAANAIDGKRSTAWIEGVDGPGIGEWIRFDFDREVKLHRILILPGYFKSPEIWRQNNRLAAATAYFSDDSSRDLNFQDVMQSQKFDVGTVKTKFVRLLIKQVYYGTDPDTAISEIAFEWEP